MRNDVIFERLRKHGIVTYDIAFRTWRWTMDDKPMTISEAIIANEELTERIKQGKFYHMAPKRFRNKVRGINRKRNELVATHESRQHKAGTVLVSKPSDYNARMAVRMDNLRKANA